MERELKKIITDLIETPIKGVDEILPNNSGWSDTVEALIKLDPNIHIDDKYYRAPTRNNRPDHIHRRLGHITVNPTKKDNTTALKETYVYSDVDDAIPSVYVNKNPKSAEAFLNELIKAAHEERNFVVNKNIVDSTGQKLGTSPFILHGERGIGKTFFLNHIFSKYHQHLDDNKVIWVRLNLLDDFMPIKGHESQTLIHWIYAQHAKIVFRYYDPNSKLYPHSNPKPIPLDLTKDIIDYIKSNKYDKDHERDLIESLSSLKQTFYSMDSEEPLTPGLVPPLLGKKIFELARSKGYSHVIVIDGLDRLEITERYKIKFEQLIEQVCRLTKANDPLGIAFLLVMRTNSLHFVFDIEPSIDPYKHGIGKAKKLMGISIEKIFEKRVEYLKKEVQAIALQQKNEKDWPLNDWPLHIDEFSIFVSNNLRDSDTEYHKMLTEIFAGNKRTQTQFIQLSYFDFLNKKHERSYLLTESLIKAGFNFPSKFYYYSRCKNTQKLIPHHTKRFFDNHFLPSIFLYPYVNLDKEESMEIPNQHGILAGIRILQILRAHEQLIIEKGPKVDRLQISELIEICNEIFKYPNELISALVDEFGEYELISFGGNNYPTARNQIFLMPKGNYILNKFLHHVSYIYLAAMRVPLSNKALDYKTIPYLYAYASIPQKDDFIDVMFTRMVNTIGMYRLLFQINKVQQGEFSRKFPFITNPRHKMTISKAEPSMFNFLDHMKRSILNHFNTIIPSIRQTEIEILYKKISNYSVVWK